MSYKPGLHGIHCNDHVYWAPRWMNECPSTTYDTKWILKLRSTICLSTHPSGEQNIILSDSADSQIQKSKSAIMSFAKASMLARFVSGLSQTGNSYTLFILHSSQTNNQVRLTLWDLSMERFQHQ